MTSRALTLAMALGAVACSNPSTPASHVGYCTRGAYLGKASFYGLQTGPTSTGLGWLLSCQNVPITPITFDEQFKVEDGSAILSKDNLQIAFAVHLVFKIAPEKVRDLMEHFALDLNNPVHTAYAHYLKEPLRTIARAELQKFDSFGIKDNIDGISHDIDERVKALAANTPFEIVQVVVGNIQYPKQVADAVANKMATAQNLEQQDTQLKIVQKQAEQRVAEAQGIAEAQRIINATLTSNYLQHEAIEAQKAMVGSPNHTVEYIPVGPLGVPIVATLGSHPGSETAK
jgi:regulator of protease activity HflC (stomatin/prohibitin superfamily)